MTCVESLSCSLDNVSHRNLGYYNLNLYLRQEVNLNLSTTIVACIALLCTEAENLSYSDTCNAEICKSNLKLFKLILLADDRNLCNLCVGVGSGRCSNLYGNGLRHRSRRLNLDIVIVHNLRGCERHKVCVARYKTMLFKVKTNDFFVLCNSEANCLLDYEECDNHHNCCPYSYCKDTKQLNTKELCAAAVEETCVFKTVVRNSRISKETNCDSTPHTVEHMYSNRTNRVVNLKYIIKEPYAEYYQETGYDTNNRSADTVKYVTTCCDTYKTCK